MTDPDCLFCKIVAGEIPSTEVTSSAGTYAFRDINPGAPTHVLVVPRRHIESAATVTADDAETLAELIATAQEVARLLAVQRETGGTAGPRVDNGAHGLRC